MKVSSTGNSTSEAVEDEGTSRRGRPRDAAIGDRILAAAKAVYAERGWSGFNFDAVARRAKVSKDAIYRRYGSQIELLMASWSESEETHRYELALSADADIRDYLLAVAKDHFVMYTGATRFEYLRVYIEAKHNPELLEAFHRDRSSQTVSRVRGAVREAMHAGTLPLAVSPTAVIDAVIGGVAMHVMVTPPDLHEKMVAGGDAYLAELVDLVLRGCGYVGPPKGATATA
jgi:AcrR family transcriptional regulator